MNTSKALTTILATLVLTACGSGFKSLPSAQNESSNLSSTSTPSPTTPTPATPIPTTPTTPNTPPPAPTSPGISLSAAQVQAMIAGVGTNFGSFFQAWEMQVTPGFNVANNVETITAATTCPGGGSIAINIVSPFNLTQSGNDLTATWPGLSSTSQIIFTNCAGTNLPTVNGTLTIASLSRVANIDLVPNGNDDSAQTSMTVMGSLTLGLNGVNLPCAVTANISENAAFTVIATPDKVVHESGSGSVGLQGSFCGATGTQTIPFGISLN